MKLTSKSLLAINAVLDIILLGGEAPIAKSEIAKRHKVSVSYLDQLFMRLRRADVIASVRGPAGGYRVTRPLSTVTLAEIVAAVEERPEKAGPGRPPLLDLNQRLAGDVWKIVGDHMMHYLATISLGDVVQLGARHQSPTPAEGGKRRRSAKSDARQEPRPTRSESKAAVTPPRKRRSPKEFSSTAPKKRRAGT